MILDYDRDHLWHPYTSMTSPLPCYEVVSARGVYLELSDGRQLIDGMSSWWAAIHGYNHPKLNQALVEQSQRMSHVMFGGLTHRPAVELAQKILSLVPQGLEHIFYADSGSVAVEVSMKMALQYQHSQGKPQKNRFLTISGGYHGDTWHCMSVCDPEGGMHTLWNGRLGEQIFVPRPEIEFNRPWNDSDIAPLERAMDQYKGSVAALILEPVVQGAGGMRFYHPQYLRAASELCKRYDILLIADEIATGFGRSGKMFASEWAAITPDIMCIGKALTGGYMTFAAVIATSRVAHGIKGSFMHGPTFMGNPLAAAVAGASLDLLIDHSPLDRISEIEQGLNKWLAPALNSPRVKSVRTLGAIGVVEMNQEVDMATMQAAFVERGVWVRPFGRLVYVMPPYVITDSELETLCRALVEVVS